VSTEGGDILMESGGIFFEGFHPFLGRKRGTMGGNRLFNGGDGSSRKYPKIYKKIQKEGPPNCQRS